MFGFIKRWRGLQRYRCRECTKAFYRPLLPTERPGKSDSETSRHRSRSERSAARKKRQRRTVELLVFVTMLAIFLAALRVLIHGS